MRPKALPTKIVGNVPMGAQRVPAIRIKLKEFDTVALEISRLYRNLPPKHNGRLMQAALDPFWQILSGDINVLRYQLLGAADGLKRDDIRLVDRCLKNLRAIRFQTRYNSGRIGGVYKMFFLNQVKQMLRKCFIWKQLLLAKGLKVPICSQFGPRRVGGRF